jgi:uncharacterized protein (TIGR03066 family)
MVMMRSLLRVVLTLGVLFLVGCGRSGGRSPAATLVGTWDVSRPERSRQVYEFRKGGILVIKTELEPNEWGRPSQGTWEILESKGIALAVRLRYDGREENLIINVQNSDTLTLSDWKGRDIIFRRRK